MLAPGTVLPGIVDVAPPGGDVEVLASIVVVVSSVVVVGHVGSVVVVVSATVDVVVGSVVVVWCRVVVVVVQCRDVVGGDVVAPTVGTTWATVVDVVEVGVLVVVVGVVLVQDPVVTADARRSSTTAGAFGGRGGGEDVAVAVGTAGTVEEVVVLEVDDDIKTSEVGPTRSGIRPSLPSIVPANSVTARTPTRASTTPLDAAMIVDR